MRRNSGPDRLVIVTGGGSGIGRSVVLRLARSGYFCVITGRRKSLLDETVALVERSGGRAVAFAADMATEEGQEGLFAKADRIEYSRLCGLVNNAATSKAAPLFAQDRMAWRNELAINLDAVAFLSFAAMERMAGDGGGAIVNIGSVYGGIIALNNSFYEDVYPSSTPDGPVRAVAYAASKGAVRSLTRELAVAGAPLGIRVNVVSPGSIVEDSDTMGRAEKFGELSPVRRVGHPREVAGAVAFLLSEEASYITGAELVIDGGWSVW